MKAAPRLRTFTLWTGTLLCVLIAAARPAGQPSAEFVYDHGTEMVPN